MQPSSFQINTSIFYSIVLLVIQRLSKVETLFCLDKLMDHAAPDNLFLTQALLTKRFLNPYYAARNMVLTFRQCRATESLHQNMRDIALPSLSYRYQQLGLTLLK